MTSLQQLGPRPWPILGNAPAFARDPIGFARRCQSTYGDIIRLNLFGVEGLLVLHPEDVEHVLVKRQKVYSKQTRGVRKLQTVFGQGLLTSDGDFWRRQRRIAQPAFRKGTIASFAKTMAECADAMCSQWESAFLSAPDFDLYDEMMRVTLRVVGETLLGQDVSDASSKVGVALEHAIHITNKRVVRPFDIPTWLPTPENLKLKRAIEDLDDVVQRIIDTERGNAEPSNTLLSMLLHAKDPETQESMSDRQLRDEVLIMFVAGHETTANTRAWFWYNIATHPEVAAKISAEIHQIYAERPLEDLSAISELTYTTAAIEETMRLYPPGWWFARIAQEDDTIRGYDVKAGDHIWMCAYLTQRHASCWQDPDAFNPERLLVEGERPKLASFPFGAGPRHCIGSHFAMLEMKIIIAAVFQKFRMTLPEGFPVALNPSTTLRPKHGLRMSLSAK